jgi:predicted AAA+ superfamily ATPase
MIDRAIVPAVRAALGRQAAVALLGPRQVGKTTLALGIARHSNAIYLDLQKVSDRAKLIDPSAYLSQVEDRLVILDEVHRTPDLFPILRGVIDEGRRRGHRTGRFLILGSASTELLRQSGESLAGRISYLDMGPVHPGEVDPGEDERLWVRDWRSADRP